MVYGPWCSYVPTIGSPYLFKMWLSLLILKVDLCLLSPDLWLWRMLEIPELGLTSGFWFLYGHWYLIHLYSIFWILTLISKVPRISMSFKSWFGALLVAGVPDWGLASSYWFWYVHWSFINPWYKFKFYILILKVQRTSMSFKSWFGALLGAGGVWLGCGFLILILIWSLDFDTPKFQIFNLCPDFADAKNIHVL